MTATITATNGAGTSTPLAVGSPYETQWQGRNVVHDLIGGGIAVSLVQPRPRSGDLELLYETEEDAFDCAALHRVETTFTLIETSRPHISMTYVVDGVQVALNPETLHDWTVTIGYQEVTP